VADADATDRARMEQAMAFAWVLWHSGLTASSVFALLAELLRRTERKPTGAAVRVLVSDFGVTVTPFETPR
jgi:hypothetical protein